jgi:osmotically inducible protein OsmC
MKRSGSAVWRGDLKAGKGTVSSASGVLKDTPYSFTSRFESGTGTNPEELIAAAHAGCFSMAFAVQLGTAGLTPKEIATTANLTMEKLEAGWTITAVHLDVKAQVPGATQEKFDTAANAAKAGCPVSRVLNAKITMTATLEGGAK